MRTAFAYFMNRSQRLRPSVRSHQETLPQVHVIARDEVQAGAFLASLKSDLSAIAGRLDLLQFGQMILGAHSSRRLTGAIAGFFALASAASSQAPEQETLPFVLKPVAPGIYAAIDGPSHSAGSNSGFVIGDDGVLVIDSFFNPAAARALVAAIHRLTPKPIRYLVNTHYHIDHTGGDQVLRETGAIIIAHRNVRGWVRTYNINLLGEHITPELKAQIETVPLPDLVTDKDLIIWLGSRKVVIQTVLGHTGGDLTVGVPDAKVLFTGDLLWRKVPPNLIDGSVDQWTATDADFLHMPNAAETIFVPGHGDVADIRDVQDFRAYLLELRRLVAEGRMEGLKDEPLERTITLKLRAAHPDWMISDRAAALEVRYMDQELAGTKHRPIPLAD